MALINFYQQDNIWTVGDKVGLSAGQYFKKTDASGKISVCHELNAIFGHDNGIVAVGLPTEFCDASGDAYTDLAAFKTATDDFFFNVAQSGGTISAGFSTVRITGDGGTDYDAPSDLDISGALFALNPDDAEVSALMVGEVKTIRFAVAPIIGDFPLVIYTKT